MDAHWCSFGTYGENDQCPLLDELEILMKSKFDNIILIDDARLFLSPPPLPNKLEFYPSLSEILNVFHSAGYYTIVFEDNIISVPSKYRAQFSGFMQNKITIESLHVRKYKFFRKLFRPLKKYFQ